MALETSVARQSRFFRRCRIEDVPGLPRAIRYYFSYFYQDVNGLTGRQPRRCVRSSRTELVDPEPAGSCGVANEIAGPAGDEFDQFGD
jgi:hypothetical protein